MKHFIIAMALMAFCLQVHAGSMPTIKVTTTNSVTSITNVSGQAWIPTIWLQGTLTNASFKISFDGSADYFDIYAPAAGAGTSLSFLAESWIEFPKNAILKITAGNNGTTETNKIRVTKSDVYK